MMINESAVTLTVVSNMTSNYGEGLGNISSVQKLFKNGKVYAMRSRESLKNAIMTQSGMYDDLETSIDSAAQKEVSEELNATNCRALEGGYMKTSGTTYKRNSSFHLTDAVACNEFVNEPRFHNNLYLAENFASKNNLNLQDKSKECGLMPYQYEYDRSYKIYSLTIDLEQVGKDKNFDTSEASNQEKADRVISILNTVEELRLLVKGSLDNSEPLFIVGGLGNRKTHYFENVVSVEGNTLAITKDLKNKIGKGYYCGLLEGGNFNNERKIKKELNPLSIGEFFDKLRENVKGYYEV